MTRSAYTSQYSSLLVGFLNGMSESGSKEKIQVEANKRFVSTHQPRLMR